MTSPQNGREIRTCELLGWSTKNKAQPVVALYGLFAIGWPRDCKTDYETQNRRTRSLGSSARKRLQIWLHERR